MPTFLVNGKMDPALAARVDASVRGRRGAASSARPRLASLLRATALVAIASTIALVVQVRREERRIVESTRAALLSAVRAKEASLAPEDRAAVDRASSWLRTAGGAYEGDRVGAEARGDAALAQLLARDALYVRLPLRAVSDETATRRAAASSYKDALLLCLVAPPDVRSEKALLAKARAACSSELLAHTANVHRLDDASRALPLLAPSWSAQIASAASLEDIEALRKVWERTPIDEALRGARSRLLIAALDEDGDGLGPTELDGERPHHVRVHVVDLATGSTLLRVRKRVDPGGISATARATHASGIDGCGLALDVRDRARGG